MRVRCRAQSFLKKVSAEMRKIMGEVLKQEVKSFFLEEDGVGVVELILILVVLIGLVAIFKTQLTGIINKIFKTISTNAGKI